MSDVAFLLLAFKNVELLMTLMVVMVAVLYLLTRTHGFGMGDPLHFYYAFTFGTAYGVVTFLAETGDLSTKASLVVGGFGVLWLAGFIFGQYAPLKPFIASTPVISDADHQMSRRVLMRVTLCSAALVVVYLVLVGSPFNVESRFEANRGIGFLTRLLDPMRLICSGLLFLYVRDRSWFWRLAALAFLVTLALASGAKFALLECGYAAWMTSQLSKDRLGSARRLNVKQIASYSAVALLSVGFVLILLSYGRQAQEAGESDRTAYIEGVPLALELLALRIIGNGDMYYSGLPEDVVFKEVDIENPIAQLFGPIVGDSVMQKIFSYPLANTEVGRQIWLYWNPGDPIIRGPTSHFDLVGYAYFGPVVGAAFCLTLGLTLGWLRRSLVKSAGMPAWKAALLATLYMRALVSLLSPAISISYLVDVAIVALILTVRIFPCASRRNQINHVSS